MARPLLVIGNKNYSSWSLRPWIAMRQARIEFDEHRIALYTDAAKREILSRSPAGKVPILVDGEVTVWDSLAILEYLAERHPAAGLWPADLARRAHARAISAEMHSGFAALRQSMSMNVRRRFPGAGHTPQVDAEIARITAMWTGCLEASGGPFLYGAFGNADAMYAPVVSRFITYAVELPPLAQAYVERVRALPAMQAWYRAAESETEVIPQFEPYAAAP